MIYNTNEKFKYKIKNKMHNLYICYTMYDVPTIMHSIGTYR